MRHMGAAILSGSCLALSSLSGLDAQGEAVIRVNAAERIGPVNDFIFGQNVEAADTAGIFGETQVDKIREGDGFWLPQQGKPSQVMIEKSKSLRTGMLRYPGGCLAHNFDWRKAVGPRAERGDWQFGLDEYLLVCKEIGAEPMITISDYVLPAEEMPQHAAELVEYLNMPATPEYPWAMKRKEWGHPEPYGVKWFELGNESNHGNHDVTPRRQFTPNTYARYANDVMKAMRAVDPSIKLGVVTEAGGPPESQWNRIVLREAGKNADFVVVHQYLASIGRPPTPEEEKLNYIAALSSSDQTENVLKRYRAAIHEEVGKPLPIANTEYNNLLRGDKPKAYRFTLAGALVAADAVRIFLKPETGLATANFWQMFYGYFGPVRIDLKSAGAEGDYETRDLGGFAVMKLWGEHFGDELVGITVDSPKGESPGLGYIPPATGTELKPPKLLREISPRAINLSKFDKPNVRPSLSDSGVLRVDLDKFTGNYYPEIMYIPRPSGVGPDGCNYELDYEARFVAEQGSEGASLCLGMGDSRGWEATESAVAITGVDGPQWKEIAGTFRTLPDAPGINLVVRIEPGSKPVTGYLEIRNIRLRAISKPVFPAYDLITASASLSEDGSKLFVIVFNKSLDRQIPAKIEIAGFTVKSARRWEVNGPDIGDVDNVKEVVSGENVPVANSMASIALPAHSMTAFEFEKSSASKQ